MKKLLSVIMAAVMLISVTAGTSVFACAAELTSGACGSGVKYSYSSSDKTLTISGKGTMTDYKKRSLSPFSGREEIEKLVVENGVLNIGSNAFYDCTKLKEITLPASLQNIGEYAFWNCEKLGDIKIPDSVKHIGYNAFAYTAYYNKDSNWDYGVLYIGNCLVATNDNLQGVCNIKAGTRLIAKSAFNMAVDLTGVSFPDSVTYIDEGTFSNCSDLVNVNLTGKIKSIGDSAFINCPSINALVIKEGTRTIGKYAFNCCDSIKSVSIPTSVKKVDFAAFYPCAGLKNVTYSGTFYQWNKIKFEKSNGPLLRAKLSCTDDIKGVKLKAAKKSIKVSWKKVKGATRYEIKYSRKKDMSKAVTVKTKKASVKLKKLKKGKKYYVSVRAVRGKQKSQWTVAKAKKAK